MDHEPHHERRLMLALALSAAVLLLSLYFTGKMQHLAPKPVRGPAPAARQRTPVRPAPAPPAAKAAAPAAVTASAEQATTIDTPQFHLILSNRGGVVESWVLTHFHDAFGRPLNVVNEQGAKLRGYPLRWSASDPSLQRQLNQALFRVTEAKTTAGPVLTFNWSNGAIAATKTISFGRGYKVNITSAVTVNGQPVPVQLAWPGGFGDSTSSTHYQNVDLFRDLGKLDIIPAKDLGDHQSWSGDYNYLGIEDQYFAAVFLPANPAELQATTFRTHFVPNFGPAPRNGKTPQESKGKPVDSLGLAVGDGATNNFLLFVGPKQKPLLNALNPDLGGLVDYGWFTILADPLFLWLHWTYLHWVHNYGWAIIIVTLIINLAIMPLRVKAQKSMVRMQQIQPKLKPIQDRMKKYSAKDPRRLQAQQEYMAAMSEAGVNPLGGCLPMLIPLPLIIAFYRVLENSVDLRHKPWIGYVHDLSARDPYYILPIVLAVTMIWSSSLMPMTPGADPRQMKMMKWVMPLFMGWFFVFLPSGVNLYYLATNVIMVAQTFYLNKHYRMSAASPKAAARK